jgi:hypothetical protein
MSSETRTKNFARNSELEFLLKSLNNDLWIAEEKILHETPADFEKPVVLIFGPLRSGTTLFLQWLANSGLVAYPTNLLSRFYNAPVLGAKIQLLLTDPRYNFRDELGEFPQTTAYESENGKTRGVLAPNEFWYFWKRFLADPERELWTDAELKKTMDVPTMKAELSGLTKVFQKPFAAKAMLFNYNIPFLDSVLENAVFIQIKRDPVANVASALDARKKQYGNIDTWYSFTVPEYNRLIQLDPVAQCAGQIVSMNNAVTQGLELVDPARKMIVQYENFCKEPQTYFEELLLKLGISSTLYNGPGSFSPTRKSHISNKDDIVKALQRYESN